jgi:hypothetical protein
MYIYGAAACDAQAPEPAASLTQRPVLRARLGLKLRKQPTRARARASPAPAFKMLQPLLQRVVFGAKEGHHLEGVVLPRHKLLLHRLALR